MPTFDAAYVGSQPVTALYQGSALIWTASGGGGGGGPLTAFSLLGTHPQAAAQATTLGQQIRTLKTFGGKVYAAYGDIGANTGPIAINPFDHVTNTFTGVEWTANTEAIYTYRVFGGKLYAAEVDPRGANGGYAVLSSGSWSETTPIFEPLHVPDAAVLNGNIYLCGWDGGNGRVWKSTDGGSTFSTILAVPGGSFWWLAVVGTGAGQRLVAQAFGDFAKCQLYDGTSWTDGPNVNWYNDMPEVFNGVLIVAQYSVGLRKFDGTTATTISGFAADEVLSITSDETQTYCYVLKTDLTVQRSADLTTWATVATGLPAAASAITVCSGHLYVGTTDSKLWRSTDPLPA